MAHRPVAAGLYAWDFGKAMAAEAAKISAASESRLLRKAYLDLAKQLCAVADEVAREIVVCEAMSGFISAAQPETYQAGTPTDNFSDFNQVQSYAIGQYRLSSFDAANFMHSSFVRIQGIRVGFLDASATSRVSMAKDCGPSPLFGCQMPATQNQSKPLMQRRAELGCASAVEPAATVMSRYATGTMHRHSHSNFSHALSMTMPPSGRAYPHASRFRT